MNGQIVLNSDCTAGLRSRRPAFVASSRNSDGSLMSRASMTLSRPAAFDATPPCRRSRSSRDRGIGDRALTRAGPAPSARSTTGGGPPMSRRPSAAPKVLQGRRSADSCRRPIARPDRHVAHARRLRCSGSRDCPLAGAAHRLRADQRIGHGVDDRSRDVGGLGRVMPVASRGADDRRRVRFLGNQEIFAPSQPAPDTDAAREAPTAESTGSVRRRPAAATTGTTD